MSEQRRLEGKAAVITGAGGGIGRAIALEYAAAGASLLLCDLNTDNLPALEEQAKGHGVEVVQRTTDVTDPVAAEEAMAAAEQAFGKLDILVNCAGIFRSVPFLDYKLEDWKRLMDINVNGTFLCTQAALRRMVPKGRGKVVNLSSVAGKRGAKYRAAYYASKHAVIGLTRCVAMEMAEHGITVNAICPGMVDTGMFDGLLAEVAENVRADDPEALRAQMLKAVPIGRMIQPEEVAHLALYLASPDSDGMTGQAITLSGGMLMA